MLHENRNDRERNQARLGKGNTEIEEKRCYVRAPGKVLYFYTELRTNYDPKRFKLTTLEEFDAIFEVSKNELASPIKVRLEQYRENQLLHQPRSRTVPEHTIFFIFLCHLTRSSNESIGLARLGTQFGLSIGTLSNYIRHAWLVSIYSLKRSEIVSIRWPRQANCRIMENLICGFPHYMGFADYTNLETRCPWDVKKKNKFHGHLHFHCVSTFV